MSEAAEDEEKYTLYIRAWSPPCIDIRCHKRPDFIPCRLTPANVKCIRYSQGLLWLHHAVSQGQGC